MDTLGRRRMVDALLPEDLQKLHVDLIATRAVSTVNHYLSLIDKGCMHPIDKAAVTVAVYTGLRPGELCTLAVEDAAPDFSNITVRRSVTQSMTFKMPKTKKERTVLLQPPARKAVVNDYSVPSAWNTKWGTRTTRCW